MSSKKKQQLAQMRHYNDLIREQTTESEKQLMAVAGNISIPQLHVLLAVANHTPCTMSMIAKATNLTHGNITQTVDRLEAKKLLKRVRSNEDRRIVNVVLTAKGEKVSSAYHESVDNVFSGWFSKLSSAEVEQLLLIMGKITR